MTEWQHEPEFRQLMRQCLEGRGCSQDDFNRLVAMTGDMPAEWEREIGVLMEIMAREAWTPDA